MTALPDYNEHPMDEQVIAILNTIIPAENGMAWEILRWPNKTLDGPALQVAEVGQSDATGGWTYMQSDVPFGLAVCAAVERLTLAIEDGDPDWIEDETLTVKYLLTTDETDN